MIKLLLCRVPCANLWSGESTFKQTEAEKPSNVPVVVSLFFPTFQPFSTQSCWRRRDALKSVFWKCFLVLLQGETVWRSLLERLTTVLVDRAPIARSLPSNAHTHTHTPPLPSALVWLPPRILPFMCNFEYIVPPWKNTTLNSSHLSLAPPLIWARLIFTAASVLLPSRFRADGV